MRYRKGVEYMQHAERYPQRTAFYEICHLNEGDIPLHPTLLSPYHHMYQLKDRQHRRSVLGLSNVII
jgi:hypothetical protein